MQVLELCPLKTPTPRNALVAEMVLYEVESGELLRGRPPSAPRAPAPRFRGAETYASVRAPPFKRSTYTSRSSTKRSVPSPRRNGAGFLRASAQARTSSARIKERCSPYGPYVSPSTPTGPGHFEAGRGGCERCMAAAGGCSHGDEDARTSGGHLFETSVHS